jgi:hypothetical protein
VGPYWKNWAFTHASASRAHPRDARGRDRVSNTVLVMGFTPPPAERRFALVAPATRLDRGAAVVKV